MESKYLKYLWKIINIVIIMTIWANTTKAQSTFEYYQKKIFLYDSLTNISDFDVAYIVHFNFCSSNKYCGKKLIKYLENIKKQKVILLCDDINNPLLESIRELPNFTIKYIDQDFLQKHGVFSVYNLEISSKHKKVKKLI